MTAPPILQRGTHAPDRQHCRHQVPNVQWVPSIPQRPNAEAGKFAKSERRRAQSGLGRFPRIDTPAAQLGLDIRDRLLGSFDEAMESDAATSE